MSAKRKIILAYLFFPILGFPIYFVIANVIDSIFGEMQLLTWLLFEPLSLLLKITLKDWMHSIPVMFMVFIGLFLPVHLVLAMLNRLTPGLFSGIVSAVMFIFSYAVGFSVNAIMANTLTVMLLAVFTGVFSKPRRITSGIP